MSLRVPRLAGPEASGLEPAVASSVQHPPSGVAEILPGSDA